jgi:hypothetical protein
MVLSSRQMVRLLFELGAVVPQPSKVKLATHPLSLGLSNAKVCRADIAVQLWWCPTLRHIRACSRALCIVVFGGGGGEGGGATTTVWHHVRGAVHIQNLDYYMFCCLCCLCMAYAF